VSRLRGDILTRLAGELPFKLIFQDYRFTE
jgi:hypothetical protein